MKIIIEYCEEGEYLPDHEVQGWYDDLTQNIKNGVVNGHIRLSSELMVEMTRLLVVRGILKRDEIIYRYKGEDLLISKNGRIHKWPKGFCDNRDNIMEEILTKTYLKVQKEYKRKKKLSSK